MAYEIIVNETVTTSKTVAKEGDVVQPGNNSAVQISLKNVVGTAGVNDKVYIRFKQAPTHVFESHIFDSGDGWFAMTKSVLTETIDITVPITDIEVEVALSAVTSVDVFVTIKW